MLFLVTVAVLLASANAKFYTDCGIPGSKLATIEMVGVSGCADDAKQCVLKRNTNVTISIDFTPSSDVPVLNAAVHGVILGVPLPFSLPQPDACKDSGLSCPIKSGAKASYRASLPVLKSYPQVKVDVKWELKDQQGEDLICILIPAKIK